MYVVIIARNVVLAMLNKVDRPCSNEVVLTDVFVLRSRDTDWHKPQRRTKSSFMLAMF